MASYRMHAVTGKTHKIPIGDLQNYICMVTQVMLTHAQDHKIVHLVRLRTVTNPSTPIIHTEVMKNKRKPTACKVQDAALVQKIAWFYHNNQSIYAHVFVATVSLGPIIGGHFTFIGNRL